MVYEYGNAHGRLVIMVHGGPGGHAFNSCDAMAFHNWRIIAFDQRFCGRSKRVGNHTNRGDVTSPNNTIDDIEAIRKMHCKKNEKIVLFGGSYGGGIALLYSLVFGQFLDAIILRSPYFFRLSHRQVIESKQRTKHAAWRHSNTFSSRRLRDNMISNHYGNVPHTEELINAVTRVIKRKGIHCYIIHSTEDSTCAFEDSYNLYTRIPGRLCSLFVCRGDQHGVEKNNSMMKLLRRSVNSYSRQKSLNSTADSQTDRYHHG